ncbi:hypothetical protein [Oenococcus kitaharae]|uniref:Membrane protein 6-pyruvoyl-tetrahydropterin synthase-related domain-containing protein n=1 Tax=Oenococcus kitaharae DSM 17330 TaxID=1045004 RepID=G9WGH4_9LACO|nr:hypothetical protein [Oenococcus kitaharae]EHN59801.1 hypothetical protein OKIT_1726 [Oenococcus kitaharae DSM 17330]OEY83619.1 hypothetical protein NT95_05830 [Oenococcus kitaharae]OEY85417.1 hypothetical protein NT96_02275 [Oenococcus kitaharae]OEY86270.1 hypothetical protein NV75_02225 [Oenococcus kitaharae]
MAKIRTFVCRRHDILILVAVAVSVLLPYLFARQIYNQDDFLFHKNRLLMFYQAVATHFDFHPMVFDTMARGYGYAADLFYPSLWTLPFVIFYYFGFGFIASYYGLLLVYVIATAVISYYCGLSFFKKRQQALFAAVLYTTSSYYAIDLFVRGALGEAMVYSFVPLFFLGFYRLVTNQKYGVLITGIALGTIANIHFLSVYMIVGIVIIFNLLLLIQRKYSLRFLYRQTAAYSLAVILSASVILPILEQMIHGSYRFMGEDRMAPQGLTYLLGSLISNSFSNNAGVWQNLAPNIGPILVITLIYAGLRFGRMAAKTRQLFLIASSFFVLSSNLLFWSFADKTPLAKIQFEWRLLTFATLFAVILLTMLVGKTKYQVGLMVLSVLLTMTFNFRTLTNFQNMGIHATTDQQFSSYGNEIIGGGEEFVPNGINYDKPPKHFQTRQITAGKTIIIPTEMGDTIYQSYHFPKATTVIFPKYYYYGYRVTLSSGQRAKVFSHQGYAAARIPKGQGTYLLAYEKTPLQNFSILLASFAWLLTAFGILLIIKHRIFKSFRN